MMQTIAMSTALSLLALAAQAAGAPGPSGIPSLDRPPPSSLPGLQQDLHVAPAEHVARGPSLAVSLKLAEAIVAACGGDHVGVTVIDAEGQPKLVYIPDGTAGAHASTGFRKANTALKFGMPSGKVAEATKADSVLAAKFAADPARFTDAAGGIPIMVGTDIIGAVGVSGVESDVKDEACAADGMKAVARTLR
jgi:uncharacterized protein GlcG (DUF336 family)